MRCMRRIGLILSTIGALGLLLTAFSFATDYQPMWIRVVKHLPDKDTFTHQEVAAAVIRQIENTRADFYLGVLCSVLQVAGAVCLWKGPGPNQHLQPAPR